MSAHHDHAHPVHRPQPATPSREATTRRPPWQPAVASGHVDSLGQEGLLELQRSAGNAATAGLVAQREEVADVVSGGGQPLPAQVRHEMETRMGHDFSDVRVHHDAAADASATAMRARAYTVGTNIVFQRDAFNPTSFAGRKLIAHELTHVVQQRHGPVSGTDIGGGVKVSDPADRFEREAEATAHEVMSQPLPEVAVQRERLEEEEDVDVGP